MDAANKYFQNHCTPYNAERGDKGEVFIYEGFRKVAILTHADVDTPYHPVYFPAGERSPSSIALTPCWGLEEALFAITESDLKDKLHNLPRQVVVRLKERGVTKVLDGMPNMTFIVDDFTVGLMGPVAHVRDYRHIRDDGRPQTWSLSADEYEVLS